MTKSDNICLRCSETLKFTSDEYGITLPHLSKMKSAWGKNSEEERTTEWLISFLQKESGVDIDIVTEYVTHKMNRCVKKERNCPDCGMKLKTWRAKLCLECGAEFEPLYSSYKNT